MDSVKFVKASDVLRPNASEDSIIGEYKIDYKYHRIPQTFLGFTLPSFFDKFILDFENSEKVYSPPQGYFDGIICGIYITKECYDKISDFDELKLRIGGYPLSVLVKSDLLSCTKDGKEYFKLPFLEEPYEILCYTLILHSMEVKKQFPLNFGEIYFDFIEKEKQVLDESGTIYRVYNPLKDKALKVGYQCGMMGVYFKN